LFLVLFDEGQPPELPDRAEYRPRLLRGRKPMRDIVLGRANASRGANSVHAPK